MILAFAAAQMADFLTRIVSPAPELNPIVPIGHPAIMFGMKIALIVLVLSVTLLKRRYGRPIAAFGALAGIVGAASNVL